MKPALKREVEVKLDFKVFEGESVGKKKKKVMRGSSFELIQTRPGISISCLSKTQKNLSFSKSSQKREKLVQENGIKKKSTKEVLDSLVSYFDQQSNPIFQHKKSVYSQIEKDSLELFSFPRLNMETSPYFHSWFLSYSQKCSENLEKSLKKNKFDHEQEINSLKTYYNSELVKYRTLKRTLEICVNKNRPFDTVNSYFYSILNENLALKEEIRNYKLKPGNFNYFYRLSVNFVPVSVPFVMVPSGFLSSPIDEPFE